MGEAPDTELSTLQAEFERLSEEYTEIVFENQRLRAGIAAAEARLRDVRSRRVVRWTDKAIAVARRIGRRLGDTTR